MRWLRGRLGGGSESGFTLVELLVASAMGVIVLGVLGTIVISAMRSQPELSERSQNISTARWILERMTREIRGGIAVDEATPSRASFRTFLRRTSCGAGGASSSTAPSIECQVTYTCTATTCSRIEGVPGVEGGTETTIFTGIDDSNVFTYSPPGSEDPTFIGITLHIPNPSGPADLTISDGASLRNATLGG